jgi:FkbM family methyltransferase
MLISFSSLVHKYKIDVSGVIHIGGHIGQELPSYKNSNVENILIFEPQKGPFEKLSKVANELNFENIILVNKALGNSNKNIEMICNEDGLCSSILKPKIVLSQYPDIKFDRTEEVEMITLDSYFAINENNTYNFINMDTQGYELEVLKGSLKTLEKIDAVYTEVNNAEVYENNALIQEIDEFLSSYDLVRVETDWMGGTWGDAFYINQKFL